MTGQLTLDLPSRPALGREAFFVAPSNAAAVARLEGWRDWPGRRLVLCGPKGAGKTHLAQVWAGDRRAVLIEGAALDPDIAAQCHAGARIVVENAERVAGHDAREAGLFHLYNMAEADGAHLLLTATLPPARWGLSLPDLKSRLQTISLVELEAPDDALLSALLVKLFTDRQITVSPQLITYLLSRMERSAAAAQDLVARLDRAALSSHRPLSRALAAKVLGTDSGVTQDVPPDVTTSPPARRTDPPRSQGQPG